MKSAEKYNDVIVKVMVRVRTTKNVICLVPTPTGSNAKRSVSLASTINVIKILLASSVIVGTKTNTVRQVVKNVPRVTSKTVQHVHRALSVDTRISNLRQYAKHVGSVHSKTKMVRAHAKRARSVPTKTKVIRAHAKRVRSVNSKTKVVGAHAKRVISVNSKTEVVGAHAKRVV